MKVLISSLPPELHEKVYEICSLSHPRCKTFEQLIEILDEYEDPKSSVSVQH